MSLESPASVVARRLAVVHLYKLSFFPRSSVFHCLRSWLLVTSLMRFSFSLTLIFLCVVALDVVGVVISVLVIILAWLLMQSLERLF